MSLRARHNIHVVLVSLLLTVFVSLVFGMIFEAVGSALDARRNPQIGKSYDVGGRRLNLDCTGAGGPTVILESGLGVPGYGWYKVQPEVAKFARVCSYDRAGYGWSDRHTTPRNSRMIAGELHSLLAAAGVKPPYILVGHSLGGFNIRVFNGLWPGEVAGLVFVDSSHPDQESHMSPEMRALSSRLTTVSKLIPLAINIGLVRTIRLFKDLPLVSAKVTGEARQHLEFLTLQPKMFRASSDELALFGNESAQQVRESGNAGDKPLIVLTAGVASAPDAAFARIWTDELQPALARLSTQGKRIIVPDSTHMMIYDRPDAIVSAIQEVATASKQ